MLVHNVHDGRTGLIGSWEIEPLSYDALRPSDVGRTVIYHDHERTEAGTLTSWRGGVVFAQYSRGDTAAGSFVYNLVFGIRPMTATTDE